MRGLLLGCFAVFLASCGAAFAQSEIANATLNGFVSDPAGAAVPGAAVKVSSKETGQVRATITSGAGLYNFSQLPVGLYDLTIEAAGFKTVSEKGIPLGVGAVITRDLSLQIGTTQETLVVTSEIPLVETSRSQTSTTISSAQVRDLPINGRNFLDFTVLTPGVVRDPTRSGDLSFGGQRGTSNSLLVDGADSNNIFFGQSTGRAGSGRSPYSFSQDAVQEFQVNTNGYAAEIGRAGGGVINVITKSGTNYFHGDAFEFYRDKSLNANSWENNSRGLTRRAYHFNQFGGGIGGPVVKNKLFFYFSYDGQRNTTPNTVFLTAGPVAGDALSQQGYQMLQQYLTPYANSLNNDVYLGKVDWQINDNQRLSIRYNGNRFTGQNYENSGSSSALPHTGNSKVTTDNVAASHTLVLGGAVVLESRFSFLRDGEPGLANSTAPEAVIRQGGITQLSIGRNSFSPRYTNAKTYQWTEGISLVHGRHSYKLGLDMDFQRIANFFPGNFSGSYLFNSYADFAAGTAFSYTQAFPGDGTSGALTKPNVGEYAFYAQDSWRATERLTLNYGVRYDYFNYAQPSVQNPNTALLSAGLNTSKINLGAANFAPRFGFAYKATGNDRVVIRGGYGWFYGRTPSILTGTAFSQNGIQVQTYTLRNGIPDYPNVLSGPPAANRTPDIFVFAPNYRQPLSSQWSLNTEIALGNDYSLTLGYLGVRGWRLTRTRDINLFPALPVAATLSDGTPVTFYRHASTRPNPAFGRISLFDSGADSIYNAGFVQLNKRFSRSFLVQTSYTYANAVDDAPDQTSVVVGADDSKDAFNTLLPNQERGRANADIRHRFVFSGIWDINYAKSMQNVFARTLLSGWQLSTIANINSGRPYTPTVSSDINNDGNSRTDRPPYAGRNSINGPWFLGTDLRITRSISLKERLQVQLIGEAFNLTNRANFSSIATAQYSYNSKTSVFTPIPNFLARLATSDPRILQLAAKITF